MLKWWEKFIGEDFFSDYPEFDWRCFSAKNFLKELIRLKMIKKWEATENPNKYLIEF